MTDDLIAWLRAQLDADEQWARDVGSPLYGEPYDPGDPGHHSRLLAEVDAKRRILDIHPHRRFASLPDEWPDHWKAEIRQAFPGTEQPYVGCEVDDFNRAYEEVEPGWWCPTVRLLALPYADRPGYRDEWRPDVAEETR